MFVYLLVIDFWICILFAPCSRFPLSLNHSLCVQKTWVDKVLHFSFYYFNLYPICICPAALDSPYLCVQKTWLDKFPEKFSKFRPTFKVEQIKPYAVCILMPNSLKSFKDIRSGPNQILPSTICNVPSSYGKQVHTAPSQLYYLDLSFYFDEELQLFINICTNFLIKFFVGWKL